MIRWMRSQVDRGTRASPEPGASMRSTTTNVHTPDCTTRFSALMARSIVRSRSVPGPVTLRTPGTQAGSMALAVFDSACPRTPNTCGSTTAAAAADAGSKRSKVSMSATHSPRDVAAESPAHARLVRPDEAGPTISDTSPRGSPPPSTRLRAGPVNGALASGRADIVEVSVRSSLRARSNAWTGPAA
jgi:hypothetical protein